MGYSEAIIMTHVSAILVDTGTAIWGTAEIAAQIQQDTRLISKYRPLLAFGTVTFASTAKALVSTALTTMIGDPVALEYPTGQDPIRYRNFEVRGGTIIPDISFAPTKDSSAFVWYNKVHTMTAGTTTANTLDTEEERILIQLVAAHLLQNKAVDLTNRITIGGKNANINFQELGNRRESQAMQDLRAISDSHHHIPQDWPKVR